MRWFLVAGPVLIVLLVILFSRRADLDRSIVREQAAGSTVIAFSGVEVEVRPRKDHFTARMFSNGGSNLLVSVRDSNNRRTVLSRTSRQWVKVPVTCNTTACSIRFNTHAFGAKEIGDFDVPVCLNPHRVRSVMTACANTPRVPELNN